MKKEQRLNDAKTKWLPTTTAKNLVRSYSKWYGVDLLCAIKELETLGFPSSKEYINQVELTIKAKVDNKRRRKEKRTKFQTIMMKTSHTSLDIRKVEFLRIAT